MKVEVGPNSEPAVIESSFGKSGKFKLRFPRGGVTEARGAVCFFPSKRGFPFFFSFRFFIIPVLTKAALQETYRNAVIRLRLCSTRPSTSSSRRGLELARRSSRSRSPKESTAIRDCVRSDQISRAKAAAQELERAIGTGLVRFAARCCVGAVSFVSLPEPEAYA